MDVWVVNHMDGECIGVYTTLKKAQAVYEPLHRCGGENLGPYVPQLISLNRDTEIITCEWCLKDGHKEEDCNEPQKSEPE